MRPVAVIGNLSLDVVDGGPPRIGGAPFYAVQALRLLGTRAVVVTKGAPRELVALGLPVVSRESSSTTAFTIVNRDGDREMAVDRLGATWTREEARGWVADALRGVQWVHAAPLLRSDFPAETLSELARGRRLSLDGQGLVRVRQTGPLRLDADFDPKLLLSVTVLKLAQEEARVLLGDVDERSLQTLGVPEVVVTRGERGSIVLAGGRLTEVPARPVAGVTDPTGAGDAFAAAYIASRSGGQHPVAAARRATALVGDMLAGSIA